MNRYLRLALLLGWQDVKQAYRRSVLGQFWITAGMAVQVAAMGLVFGLIFRTPLETYLPFLATSLIVWGYISATISEGCQAFIASDAIIKQLSLPMPVYVLRNIWKQLITVGHNLVILPFVFMVFPTSFNLNSLLVLPGLAILTLSLFSISYLLAMVSARFRDIPQVVASCLTILYFVTPVMWQPSLIPPGTAHLLLGLIRFYHLLQIVRLPLLGYSPTIENWALSLVFAAIGLVCVYLAMRKFKTQIAYWV